MNVSRKDVIGYEGLYTVSKSGKIYKNRYYRGKIKMKFVLDKNGYNTIGLTKNRKQKKYRCGRIVALAFLENPENKKTVNHKNGIKSDDRICNLEWATYSENTMHSFRILKRVPARTMGRCGKLNAQSRTIWQYTKNGKFIRKFISHTEANRKTGVHVSSLCCVVNGRRKYAGGFSWSKFRVH